MKPQDGPAADTKEQIMANKQPKLPGAKPTHRTFRVRLVAWTAYEIEISAEDEEGALASAEHLYMTDIDRFKLADGGISGRDVEPAEG